MSAFEIISADEFKSATKASPPARVVVSLPQADSPSTATGGEESSGIASAAGSHVSSIPEDQLKLTYCDFCEQWYIEEYHTGEEG